MIRVVMPEHLRTLARIDGDIRVEVSGDATQRTIIDAIEVRFPMLRGTIRNPATCRRRAFVRFFACGGDLSHEDMDAPVPAAVADGREPFMIVGAIAGG